MDPPVVLGQRLAEGAGPVDHGALADLAAVTESWATVTGKRRDDELLIWLYDASLAGVILSCAYAERAPRGMSGPALRSDSWGQMTTALAYEVLCS
jgi:hypothetical protein